VLPILANPEPAAGRRLLPLTAAGMLADVQECRWALPAAGGPSPTPGGAPMAVPLSLGPVHHLRLTVTDVERSRAFYTELLGFQVAMDAPLPAGDPHHDLTVALLQDGIVMVNGDLLIGLRPVDAARAGDRFDPFRCGLDHLSFTVAGRAELEAAAATFEERGVEHSDITDLPPFGIAVLPFKDPDGLALELTAPL
jgi:glyoxylase I family protein